MEKGLREFSICGRCQIARYMSNCQNYFKDNMHLLFLGTVVPCVSNATGHFIRKFVKRNADHSQCFLGSLHWTDEKHASHWDLLKNLKVF